MRKKISSFSVCHGVPGSKTCVITPLPSTPLVDIINTYLREEPGLRQREEGDLGSDPGRLVD